MRFFKQLLLFTALSLFAGNISALDLDIRIFSEFKIKKFSLTAISGKYLLLNDDTQVLEIYKNNPIEISIKNDSVAVHKNNQIVGIFEEIYLQKAGLVNALKINTDVKNASERIYDDELVVRVVNKELVLINRVELEHYIAGVVQSEIFGSSEDIDFFKIQAIIARTYAITNMMKHSEQGFHLCDGVHCQSYKRRCNHSNIMMATSQTFCDVVVDAQGMLISAAFHSNSGGQTANSEDVWVIETPYLKSVVDTFSYNMRNSKWEKKIRKSEWISYFVENYPDIKQLPDYENKILNITQESRARYVLGNVPTKYIRQHFGLKSTIFNSRPEGDFVVLNGKGYGHGVGLSQEGAIKMIKLGYQYEDVIKFYYTDVSVIKYTDIVKF